MKLFTLGIRDDQDPYLKRKIEATNKVSLMCAFIGFVYAPILYIHYQPLVIYPGGLFVFSSLLLVTNYLGFVQLTRFLAAFEMLVFASLFHASIIPASELFLWPFFSSMIAMTLIPWLLYDFKEKPMLFFTLAICFGLLLCRDYLNAQFEVSVDPTFYRESYLNPLTYAFAASIAALLIILIKKDRSNV